MRIAILAEAEQGVIAREELVGGFGGEFYQRADGQVFYRHQTDQHDWYANRNAQTFHAYVAAYERWRKDVTRALAEEEQRMLVQSLRRELQVLEPLGNPDRCYWSIILEQTEAGLL